MSKNLRLDELLDNKKHIYVKNVHVPRGIIVLSLIDAAGKPRRQWIPKAKNAPIDLSEQADPEMLRRSPDLRALFAAHVIELVDPEEAEKLLQDPRIQEELREAWQEVKGNASEILKARTPESQSSIDMHLQGESVVAGAESEYAENMKKLAQPVKDEILDDTPEENPDVQAKVKVIIESLALKEIKARDARNQLSNLDLTRADLLFIISSTIQGIVNKFAKKELAKMNGEFVEIDDDDDSDE